MPRILTIIFLSFCLMSLFTACSHHYYAPSDPMLLGLQEKGDIKASASIGTNGGAGRKKINYSLMAGYSPIKHLGLMANYFHLKNVNSFDGTNYGKGWVGEVALGTYYTFHKPKSILSYRKRKNSDNSLSYNALVKEAGRFITLDLYAGYGYGKVFNYYEQEFFTFTFSSPSQYNTGSSDLSFEKRFIQSAIHVRYNHSFGFSTGLKFLQVNYLKGLLEGNIPENEFSNIRYIQQTNPISMWEWMGKVEFGGKRTKFFSALTIITQNAKYPRFAYIPIVFSMGTSLDF